MSTFTIEGYLQNARNFAEISGNCSSTLGKEFIESLPRCVEQLSRLPWATLEASTEQMSETTQSTLPVLALLAAKSLSPELHTNLDAFLIQIKNFLQAADPNQIRMSPTIFVSLFQKLCVELCGRGMSLRGIHLFVQGVRIYQKTPTQITSIHPLLLQLCLESLALKVALPFLIDDIDDFSTDLKNCDGRGVLLYFYYGGMMYAGLKKYKEALFFFEACLRIPTSTLSFIMLEAYKKYILLSLVFYSEIPTVPKCALLTVNRILKPNSAAYNEIAAAFKSYNSNELNNVVARHFETFQRDVNLGLIKQVKVALTKLNIQRLTKTFLTLSLTDVAARVQLLGGTQEAERLILSMINDGEIYAKINQRDGMVVFMDNKEKYNSAKMLQKIESQITSCIRLNKRLSDLNEKLVTNPEFVSKILSGGNDDEGISSSKIQSTIRGVQFE